MQGGQDYRLKFDKTHGYRRM